MECSKSGVWQKWGVAKVGSSKKVKWSVAKVGSSKKVKWSVAKVGCGKSGVGYKDQSTLMMSEMVSDK